MSNERDRISEYFEAKGVSRGEFEALKRFGDYEQLSDGTLMRMEGDKEFRIYCEDSGWLIAGSDGPGVIVTRGFGFEKIDGVTAFRMPQIVLNPTEIAPVHGRDYRPNNKPDCP